MGTSRGRRARGGRRGRVTGWLVIGGLSVALVGSLVFALAQAQVEGLLGLGAGGTPSNSAPASATPSATPTPTPVAPGVDSKMMIVGDVFWGRYLNDWSQASGLGPAYPFQRLGDFDRGSYDAWIADLECPVTSNPKVPSSVEDDTLMFDCDPAYLPEAKKWFDVVTLANNHTDNQGGQVGLDETRKHLADNGIQHFGTFDPERHDELCDVIGMPARVTLSDGRIEQGKLPMVWCGYHGVFKTPSAESIAVVGRYADRFPVIAMPHSGAEYKAGPDGIKTTFYRGLIDAGADVVIGDHPHWVQSTEAYQGKLILYSLGNFIFDQQFNTEVTRSAVLTMEVSTKATTPAEERLLEQWLALGESCATWADDCLGQATSSGLTKLPLSYHFSVRSSDNSGKLVKAGSAEQDASLRERLSWATTIAGLSGANSGE